MTIVGAVLRENPELALFLALAIGFAVGRFRLGTFTLGPVLGTLLAGVVIGQSGVVISPVVKTVFFDLFLFATGYKVGPQFFRGLRKDALPQLALTVVICVASLVTAVSLSRLLDYDVGTAAGLLAGAFSESTVIGTASQAIQRLAIPEAEKARLVNNIPVAYAVTYLVGTTAVVALLASVAPRLLRVDLRQASRALEAKLSGRAEPAAGVRSAYEPWETRAFRVEGPGWAGRTIAQIERAVPGARIFVERMRQGGSSSSPPPRPRSKRATRSPSSGAAGCSSSRFRASARRSGTRSSSTSPSPSWTPWSLVRRRPGSRSRSWPSFTARESCCAGSFALDRRCLSRPGPS